MTFRLLHQVGHNAVWSITSLKGGVGDGLIFSPVHQDRQSIEKLNVKTKGRSLFDPQYYLPSSQKSKLRSYSFFPEAISGGFSTANFSTVAKESAKQCLQFQTAQKFSRVVIPMRYLDQMYPDYIDRQEQLTLQPFLASFDASGVKGEIVLTLPLTRHMIENTIFRTQILNWITKYPELSEIYLIYADERDTKQIQSTEFVIELLEFVHEVQQTGLKLAIGYQNTESLLFSIFDEISLSIGTFENTRIFSLDKFLVTDEERRGPKPRIYLNGLMNWIQYEQAITLRNRYGAIWNSIYEPTEYSEEVLARTAEPHFSQPDLYYHHLESIQRQFNELKKEKPKERLQMLSEWLHDALMSYDKIDKLMLLDKHGGGGHIMPWLNALKFYEKKYF